jgi:hypothetical protein
MNPALDYIKEPRKNERHLRWEKFLAGSLEGDVLAILSQTDTDHAFLKSNRQTNNGSDITFLSPYSVSATSDVWDADNRYGACGQFLYKSQYTTRRYYEGSTDPEKFQAVVLGDRILFVVTDSPLKVKILIADKFSSGVICIVYFLNEKSYEGDNSWQNLLGNIWGNIYVTPLNILLQNTRVNTCQMICPSSLATAIQVRPTVWGILEFKVWYQSRRIGVVNIPQLGTASLVDNNPSTDTIKEVTTLTNTLWINGSPIVTPP